MRTSSKALIFIGILFLSVLIPVFTHAQTQPNDYIAFIFNIVDFKPVGEDGLSIQYQVGYIPVTGSASYTYIRTTLITEINLSEPTAINPSMHADVVRYGVSKGYNVKSIVYQDYQVSKNIVVP